jgi:pullulanase
VGRTVVRRIVLCASILTVTSGTVRASDAADCDAASQQRVLHAAADSGATDAAAIWLDARLLRWPVPAAAARYRLHHSANAGMTASIGGPVRGADAALDLQVPTDGVPAELAARMPHVDSGAVLSLADADVARLAPLLQGQLLLTQEDAGERVLAATRIQPAAALDALYAASAASQTLGVAARDGSTQFALWAPTASRVSLCLYPDARGAAAAVASLQRDAASGIWRGTQAGDLRDHYYTYLVDVVVDGVGVVRNRVTDPYSLSLSSNSWRSWIGNPDDVALHPKGWTEGRRGARVGAATDMVIYELHVRDFSIGDATVPAAHRGKYLAFTDAGSDGMQHLAALARAGLTDVHLLPVFDIASIPERGCANVAVEGARNGETQQAAIARIKADDCFNWGYDPQHYTAPEGSYALDADAGAARIVEFRRMVQALHDIGLRVGMDVVYNHTSHSGQHAKSVLDRIVPGYYHRLDARGAVERSTCCENTATEHAMMAKLMIDSVIVWARDHHIDSFRFDLMGHQPRAVMERLRDAVNSAAGRDVQLLGEGWNFGEVADGARFVQASQLSLAGSGIATFSDRARDAARGGSAGDDGVDQVINQGWLNGLHYAPNAMTAGRHDRAALVRAADLLRVGLAGTLRDYEMTAATGARVSLAQIDYAGQPAGYASRPGEVVNYVENHDNQTLFDLNAFKLPQETSSSERARVQILGAALVAFSQGIAYFHAGVDLLRSKSMDRNSYDSGDWFNRVDFSYRGNFFGSGLPPAWDNQKSWPWMRPLLADTRISASPQDIAWTRDAFRDLLRIRASSSLFRLRTTADVRQRLTLLNTGPAQEPTVLVGHLDGAGLAQAGFAELLYLINADVEAHELTLPSERGKAYLLHPVQRAAQAADERAREAQFDAAKGRVRVPPRTAVVFVREQDIPL